ncbi:uncharacterized protein LOC120451543 [Drosophila santomea]|uniref:uncharacterized protein LOC120451543 n=1 Tax=Drosophila santomea TaxID=129105 RepID=UPI0019539B39|nr:uncharacterized protein LOC120451543 [Drosophila santomea]
MPNNNQVRREERAAGEGVQRQRHKLRRSVQRAVGAERSVSPQSGRVERMRGSERRRVVFHTAEVTTLRRTLGSSRQVRQNPVAARSRQCQAHNGRVEHPPGRVKGAAQFASPGNDPNDGEALTPGHLLIGQPLITLQESGTGGVCSKAS